MPRALHHVAPHGHSAPPLVVFGARLQHVVASLVARPAFWVVAVGVLFGVPLTRSIQRELPDPPPVLGTAPAFEFIDENGRALHSVDLKGKLLLIDFIDLDTPAASSDRMPVMMTIQHRLRFMGESVRMFSIGVHPDADSPERMRTYTEPHKPNPQLWSFLSGSDALSLQESLVVMLREEHAALPEWTTLAHGGYGVLVDPDLRVRGFYELREENLDALLLDMGLIANLYGPDDNPAETDS